MNELTRAELVDKICLTDATYDCCQGNCSSSCDKCEDVLNYLLDRYDETIRADEREKAIDEYTEVLRPLISELRNNIEKNRYAFIDLDLIADKLKEQKK